MQTAKIIVGLASSCGFILSAFITGMPVRFPSLYFLVLPPFLPFPLPPLNLCLVLTLRHLYCSCICLTSTILPPGNVEENCHPECQRVNVCWRDTIQKSWHNADSMACYCLGSQSLPHRAGTKRPRSSSSSCLINAL